MNLYTYVENNPLTRTDPSGHGYALPVLQCGSDSSCYQKGGENFKETVVGVWEFANDAAMAYPPSAEGMIILKSTTKAPGLLKSLWNGIKGKFSKEAAQEYWSIKASSIAVDSAENANKFWKKEMDYSNAPYKAGTNVAKIKLQEDTTFVRVFDGENSSMYGQWMMRAEDIKGLTPEQIRDKYALPTIPKYIADVTVPAGTYIRTGVAGAIKGYGSGGGIQFDLMGQHVGTFSNSRSLP